MVASPAVFLCPTCRAVLTMPQSGIGSIRCESCQSEVDVSRLSTVAGRPRFVPEICWTGTELDGYSVGEVMGAGGMGTVYSATSLEGKKAAVKFLSPSLAADPALVSRFAREIRLQEALDHPAIVKVKAHGESRGIPWFAMELVSGPTLAERLKEGQLSLAEIQSIFQRLLSALAYAHARGVVHRDLKPTNVLIGPEGAKLVDFGIAHLEQGATSHTTQLTRTDAILGTFPYMSPEQRAGKAIDARSDLYSLGVMLYESFTQERPEGAFAPIQALRPEVPSRVDELVRDLLKPNPQDRIATALEAANRLERAIAKRRKTIPKPWVAAGLGVLLISALLAMIPRSPDEPVRSEMPEAGPPLAAKPPPSSDLPNKKPESPTPNVAATSQEKPAQTLALNDEPSQSGRSAARPAKRQAPKTAKPRKVATPDSNQVGVESSSSEKPTAKIDPKKISTKKKDGKESSSLEGSLELENQAKPSGKMRAIDHQPEGNDLPVQQRDANEPPLLKQKPFLPGKGY